MSNLIVSHCLAGFSIIKNANLTLANCTATSNVRGFEILLSTFTIENCSFVNNANHLYTKAGGMTAENSTGSVTNTNISSNVASYYGGVFSLFSTLTVANTNITNNTGYGALYGGWTSKFSKDTLSSVLVSNNQNSGLNFIFSTASLKNCVATGNGGSRGGGMAIHSSNFTIDGCTFNNNFGTGLELFGFSDGSVTDSDISWNSSPDRGAGGLLINVMDYNISIQSTTITHNSGRTSGGSSVVDSIVQWHNCTISGNTAREGGGGLSLYYTRYANITNCTIADNVAKNSNGGGIYALVSAINASSVIVRNNTADNYGGGIHIEADPIYDTNTSTLNDVTITGNQATRGGGVYLVTAATAELQNCYIDQNRAALGGGIYGFNASLVASHCHVSTLNVGSMFF